MTETFIFDLETPLSEATEKLIARFGVRKINTMTIEMSIRKGETLEQAIVALNRLDIHVRNGRHSFN